MLHLLYLHMQIRRMRDEEKSALSCVILLRNADAHNENSNTECVIQYTNATTRIRLYTLRQKISSRMWFQLFRGCNTQSRLEEINQSYLYSTFKNNYC